MRAVTFAGPGDARLVERPRPHIEAPGDAIVLVTTAAIGHTDIARCANTGSESAGIIPGAEFAGHIVEAGDAVTRFQINDLVFCLSSWTDVTGSGWILGRDIDGGHADYVRVPDADRVLVKTTAAAEERALLAGGTLGLGANATQIAEAEGRGGVVAVVGCDPLGTSALAFLQNTGAFSETVAVDSHPARLALARRYGARTVDARQQEARHCAVRADIVIVGALHDFPGSEWVTRLATPGGHIIFVEPDGQALWIDSGFPSLPSSTVRCAAWPTQDIAANLAMRTQLKKPDVAPFVSHVVPLDRAPAAYKQAVQVAPGTLKVILKP